MINILIYRQLYFILVIIYISSSSLSAQKWDTLAPIPENFTFPVVEVVNEKIHIMGGGGTGGATDHHFAYDPETDKWESLAPVPYRAQQPAGAAANGKIHFFGGGFPNSGTPLNDHYIYDPVTDTWDQAADLTAPRAIHYGVALNDTVFSLAGQGVANLCQTYDPVNDEWLTLDNLPDNGFWYGAHVATEDHIYRFCGGGYTAPNKLAHRYDPGDDAWVALPLFPNATHGIAGAAIGTKIFLAGGYFDFLDRDEVWTFDTETQQYHPGVPLPIGRTYHNMVSIGECIYVLGGNNAIDPTVGEQLLRLCPFESTAIHETAISFPINSRYESGKISFNTQELDDECFLVSVFDLKGQQVYFENMKNRIDGQYEISVGELPPAIYILQLQSSLGASVQKILVSE